MLQVLPRRLFRVATHDHNRVLGHLDVPGGFGRHLDLPVAAGDRANHRLAFFERNMQRLLRFDVLNGRPLHGYFAGKFSLHDERLVVGRLDGARQTIAILQNDLISK